MKAHFLAVGFLAFGGMAFGSTITVDGNLGDWGFTVADQNQSTLISSLDSNIFLGAFEEDQNDTAGNGAFVGPNFGGQNYDAELLAAAYENGFLYLAIVSGQRPDNGFSWFAPGDLFITTDMGDYAMEMGGGQGGQAGSTIATGAAGSTYTLKSNGETKTYADADPAQFAGSIWSSVTEILDPIAPKGRTQFEINAGSTYAGSADYTYTRNDQTNQHAVMEIALPLHVFNGAKVQNIEWRPSCGNDELTLAISYVPEPASASLLVIGAFSLIRRLRPRHK